MTCTQSLRYHKWINCVILNILGGITGVFDIDDIIQVLRNENLADITTISMLTDDKDCSCDFFVLVTARSARHTEAVAETILKLVSNLNESELHFFFSFSLSFCEWGRDTFVISQCCIIIKNTFISHHIYFVMSGKFQCIFQNYQR